MHKIMALDIGTKRIGIALSDYLQVIATPHSFISRTPENVAIEEITKIAKENRVEKIVVGVPINMDGTRGPRSEKATAFAAKLSKATGIETVLYDERLSTMNAHRIMNDTNTRGQKRKDTVDTLSAQLILQSYMDLNKKR